MSIDNLLKQVRKTTDSSSFAESKYASTETYINTGDPGLNRIITGDINKGIPSGKVILFGGESSSGKSLVTATIAANALNEENFDMIFYFDSEGGGSRDFFESRGCDSAKVEHILVDSVEDAAVKIISTYDAIVNYKKLNPDMKFLCILDSLGALVSKKMINDAVEKGKQVSEMGGRAKQVNNMVKSLMIPAMKCDTSILIVNHVYDDPAAMYPSKIKQQGGGKGVQYAAHLIIQCTKRNEKSESGQEAAYKGTFLKFFTTKNRMAKPFYDTEMYLDFSKGSMKYFGLLAPAKDYGFIIQKGAYYLVPSYSDKNMRVKQILEGPNADAIWETFIDDLNDKFKEDMSYSSVSDKDIEAEALEHIGKVAEKMINTNDNSNSNEISELLNED